MSDVIALPLPAQDRRPPDAAALLAAADTDAEALADRLHDGALQALVVARYAADAAVRGGDPLVARDAVQEALVTLRRLVGDLRPRGRADLRAALAELSQRRADAGAPPLDLDVDLEVAAGLTPAARALAYRFVQAATPATGPAAVALRQEAGWAVVVAAGRPDDLTGWAARAAAVDGRLDTCGPDVRLLLPLVSDPEGDR